ncbi:MAG: hypothetical protein ACRELD_04700 [Longimicrobiales bacterium]
MKSTNTGFKTGFAGALIVLLGVGFPGATSAQSSDWWDWALPRLAGGEVIRTERGTYRIPAQRGDNDDWERRRAGDRGPIGRRDDDRGVWDERGRDERRGRGPAFCRSGEGHPVFGRRWCVDKGFGLGGRDVRWDRRRAWEDVILRGPRDRRFEDDRGLIDVLGDVVFGRLDTQRRQMGGERPLDGRWLRLDNGATVLQVRSGSLPIAELTDIDADGRVDVVLVPRR